MSYERDASKRQKSFCGLFAALGLIAGREKRFATSETPILYVTQTIQIAKFPTVMKESTITLHVKLDDQHITEQIQWEADDLPEDVPQKADAFILSLWNSENKEALGIDLWTKKMMVSDMNIFVYQNLRKLADTYERATKEKEHADALREYAEQFAVLVKLK